MDRQQPHEEGEAAVPAILRDGRDQPKIPTADLPRTINEAREGNTSARQAVVKHFLEKAALLALDHRSGSTPRFTAIAEANGILLQMANDPPGTDFEVSLENKIRERMAQLRDTR